jgi:parallel beta-helix repeat protein
MYMYKQQWRKPFLLVLISLISLVGAITPGSAYAITYSSPIVITAGGTYTGNWESTDPDVPAVQIATTQPVTITGSNIRSKGRHIVSTVSGVDLTVTHTNGYGVNPGISGRYHGRFISLSSAKQLKAERNYLESTGGIYLLGFSGDGSASQTVKIRYNQVKNIEGRQSTGTGYSSTLFYRLQFVQFDKVKHVANMEIAWNEVINEPWNSRVEDNINIYKSSGTSASHLLIHDNYIQGAYPADPVTSSFSGGGIITDGSGTTASDVTGYVDIYNNQVVSTTNYGIAIASGHNNTIYNNRVVASGYLPDTSWIHAQNIGVYVWKIHSTDYWADNNAMNNTIGFNKKNSSGTVVKNNIWLPDAGSSSTGNTSIAGAITTSTEAAEFTTWQSKLTTNGIVIGP